MTDSSTAERSHPGVADGPTLDPAFARAVGGEAEAAALLAPPPADRAPILQARGLVKRYGNVTALDGCDFELFAGEIMAVIGDNGAGKSTLIKALSGAIVPDEGELFLDGTAIRFSSPLDARRHGSRRSTRIWRWPPPSRSPRTFSSGGDQAAGSAGVRFPMIDKGRMARESAQHMQNLKIGIRSMRQPVETLSGGQRQGVAGRAQRRLRRHVVIMDEPTAALGVKETRMVLDLILQVRERGLP
jgi:fructose transport system ATP-binding protein